VAVVARHGDDRDPDADGPTEDDLFLEAVGDVEPLEGRGRVREPRPRRRSGKASRPASFTIERDGDRIEGRAHGVSHRQLADLIAGRIEPESRIDLHRHDRDAARQALERFIAGAAAAGQRCVLVIHGRGRHSDGAPVIKEEVVTILCRGATGRSVRGFCSARARHGGTGALYVSLKS
jgi:DNA-nicking Smr family endonuclease